MLIKKKIIHIKSFKKFFTRKGNQTLMLSMTISMCIANIKVLRETGRDQSQEVNKETEKKCKIVVRNDI